MESAPSRLSRSLPPRAFTLIEMLVVLAIMTIVTSIILVGHSNFDRSLLITNAAYSVALSAREMQTFGLSSRAYNLSGTNVTDIGYGIHVTTAAPTTYLAFADTQRVTSISHCPSGMVGSPDYKRGNCIYETLSPADGIFEQYTFSRGFQISRFCGKNGATTYCSNSASPNTLTSLDIVFMRPDTDAIVTGRRSAGAPLQLTSAEIYLSTADGTATRAICISQIGQISVTQDTCP